MDDFTSTSLPEAVEQIFRLNNFEVEGPRHIHGAEIDLIAKPIGQPFSSPIYIEVTIEYVDAAKYGKDLTKLILIREKEPAATLLIVSSKGFTPSVKERATESRIDTVTYDELFGRFEKFQPYVEHLTGRSRAATELAQLDSVYEPPTFEDSHGRSLALDWMSQWLSGQDSSNSWLIITGEYGTGKSALTKILQLRWLRQYATNPAAAIPVRIELGDFSKQFDAQGLLHHFLDRNHLSHVPIEFFWSLIRSGRVVLLLDGYDEMAQYLNQRERRQTLKALAELSSGGAKGILTSRPNYFTETEELTLFDHLYRELNLRSSIAMGDAEELRRRERDVDDLIQRSLLDRYERVLRDLDPHQSKALVRRILRDSPDAAATVLAILDRVFRRTDENAEVALSGKPVIISYLIEVASSLESNSSEKLSEWDVYTLVVEKLALRDLEQTARVKIDERRMFLQLLAFRLTKSGQAEIAEESFRDLVAKAFVKQLRKYSGQNRASEIDSLFEDLRRSGTLTRGERNDESTWRFSHNSLREFLVAEYLIDAMLDGRELESDPPVSDAMRMMVASRGDRDGVLVSALKRAWLNQSENPACGTYLALLWDLIEGEGGRSPLISVAGEIPRAESLHLANIGVSATGRPVSLIAAKFNSCTLFEVRFDGANMQSASFSGSLLEAVSFSGCNLRESTFRDCMLVDIDVTDADLKSSDFRGLDEDVSILLDNGSKRTRLQGAQAIGYLAYAGAVTDRVSPYFVWSHDYRFEILLKIAGYLLKSGTGQRLGLEQRGKSANNPRFAREVLKTFERVGYVEDLSRESAPVFLTTLGRKELGRLINGKEVPQNLISFLEGSLG